VLWARPLASVRDQGRESRESDGETFGGEGGCEVWVAVPE
jgi:hypothetical protein